MTSTWKCENFWQEVEGISFYLIHAESNEWGILVKQMLTEVVDLGRKLYSVDGIRFIFLTDMCSFWWQKCGPWPKLFLRLDTFSTFRGVYTLIFTCVPYTVIDLHEEPANFYREKRGVAFVTGHLFTFLVVLSLICLMTTQILICENQTIWRLEILLSMIMAALLKTKCNGRFVKTKDIEKRERNISQ